MKKESGKETWDKKRSFVNSPKIDWQEKVVAGKSESISLLPLTIQVLYGISGLIHT